MLMLQQLLLFFILPELVQVRPSLHPQRTRGDCCIQ